MFSKIIAHFKYRKACKAINDMNNDILRCHKDAYRAARSQNHVQSAKFLDMAAELEVAMTQLAASFGTDAETMRLA